jgi:hypothetical protein
MKYLLILIIVMVFSCKKQDIQPIDCYLIEWEKVTTYDRSLEIWADEPTGIKAENGQEVKCDINPLQLADLLKAGNITTKGIGICITVHVVAKKVKKND